MCKMSYYQLETVAIQEHPIDVDNEVQNTSLRKSIRRVIDIGEKDRAITLTCKSRFAIL